MKTPCTYKLMNSNRPMKRFWCVLAAFNLLALSYPVMLLYLAQKADQCAHLCAILVLIGCCLLLMVVDAVSFGVSLELDNSSVSDCESLSHREVFLVSDVAALTANIGTPSAIQR